MNQKKNSGHFQIIESDISRHISKFAVRIYLSGFKLFLTSYMKLKVGKKCKMFAIFVFLSYLKQLYDSGI